MDTIMAILKGVDWIAISAIVILFLGILFIPHDGWIYRLEWKMASFMQKKAERKNFIDKYFWGISLAVAALAFFILKLFFDMTTGRAFYWVVVMGLILCGLALVAFGYAMYGTRDKHVSTKK